MIPLSQAQERVLAGCKRLGEVEIRIGEALGLVCAEDVVATEASPPFANSSMDGFAVVSADLDSASPENPAQLQLVGTQAAGSAQDLVVRRGQAVRIMTGASIPDGADAVAIVEDSRLSDDGTQVWLSQPVPAGENIRGSGSDLQPGDLVIPASTVLRAGHLGLLATMGRETIRVVRRPRVGVMSTGDELTSGPKALLPGQIRDANRITLLSLLDGLGVESVDLGLVADDEAAISQALELAVANCDAVVTSGGVSMGDFDYVKAVLDRIGEMSWMQVAIKPAKPLAFGTVAGTPIFGLPGNPVSAMVSFELFARRALQKMMGYPAMERPLVQAMADEDLQRHVDGKTHFLRSVVSYRDGQFRVRLAGEQGSHQLSAMAEANGLAVVPNGTGVAAGETVSVMLLRNLGE